jgi:hypothetical protein
MSWNLLVLLLFALLLLLCAALVFRHGFRSTYLDRFPLFLLAFCTFGVLLLDAIYEWVTADAGAAPVWMWMAIGGFYFLAASAVWLIGFFFGRWRATKHSGVITRR